MALFCDRLCCNRPRVVFPRTLHSNGTSLLPIHDRSRYSTSINILQIRTHGLSSISKSLPLSRRPTCLRAAWVEPLVTIGVPMLLVSLFSWSIYQIHVLRSRLQDLQSINAVSKASLEQLSSNETQTEVQMKESNDTSQEIRQLKDQIIDIQKQWSVDRQRMETLEKARSAAVKDITSALASKRDVEFKLKESSERTQTVEKELNTQNVCLTIFCHRLIPFSTLQAKMMQLEELLRKEQSQITVLDQQKSDLEQKLKRLSKQRSDASK